jgi:hypothetical protein
MQSEIINTEKAMKKRSTTQKVIKTEFTIVKITKKKKKKNAAV